LALTGTFDLNNAPLMKALDYRRLPESDGDIGRVCIQLEAEQEQCHSGLHARARTHPSILISRYAFGSLR
jgi:hypothetical protein